MEQKAEPVALKPCRECGAASSAQVFDGLHVNATIWVCEKHTSLGGQCPSTTGYFTAEAWNHRANPQPAAADGLVERKPCKNCGFLPENAD